MKIKDRTFGVELEFCDLVKDNIDLPNGYGWDKEEKSLINSDGTKVTPSGKIGGEITTRPYKPTRRDIKELRSFIFECKDNGASLLWATGFDLHIFIGDLELQQLKDVFYLGYKMSSFFNDVFNHPEWFEVLHLVPIPTWEFNRAVQNTNTVEAFKNVFSNQTAKGHYRFQVNVMPFFKTKTLEFRFFNASFDFRNTLEEIKFAYTFLEFALTKSKEDIDKINTRDDFIREFKIMRKFDKANKPLIFASDHEQASRSIARAFSLNKKLLSVVAAEDDSELATVNPFMFTAEMALYEKKNLTVYNNSEYNDILFKIAVKGLKITYGGHFECLNEYKDDAVETELSLFAIFSKLQKFNLDTEYGSSEYIAHIAKIEDSIIKLKESSLVMVEMISEVKYRLGTIEDALIENQTIFYQQFNNSKNNSAVSNLIKYSDYESDFIQLKVNYLNIKKLENNKTLLIASENKFLSYFKIAKDKKTILYSTQKKYKGLVVDKKIQNYNFIIPDDNFSIDLNSKIVVSNVSIDSFSFLQKRHIKKVSKVKAPRITYLIFIDEVVIGGFGFDYTKDSNYDLFLLSDFCTNNNIRLLSKFIIMILKTKEVKKILDRKVVSNLEKSYTKVYTKQPVSMKYRGVFRKIKTEDKNSLLYEFEFGSGGTFKDAKRDYLKRVKNVK